MPSRSKIYFYTSFTFSSVKNSGKEGVVFSTDSNVALYPPLWKFSVNHSVFIVNIFLQAYKGLEIQYAKLGKIIKIKVKHAKVSNIKGIFPKVGGIQGFHANSVKTWQDCFYLYWRINTITSWTWLARFKLAPSSSFQPPRCPPTLLSQVNTNILMCIMGHCDKSDTQFLRGKGCGSCLNPTNNLSSWSFLKSASQVSRSRFSWWPQTHNFTISFLRLPSILMPRSLM